LGFISCRPPPTVCVLNKQWSVGMPHATGRSLRHRAERPSAPSPGAPTTRPPAAGRPAPAACGPPATPAAQTCGTSSRAPCAVRLLHRCCFLSQLQLPSSPPNNSQGRKLVQNFIQNVPIKSPSDMHAFRRQRGAPTVNHLASERMHTVFPMNPLYSARVQISK